MQQRLAKADELQRMIETAFSETVYPGDDHLVYDTTGEHLEAAQVAMALRGKHWRELPLDLLQRHSQSLFFMTPEAYSFYLPAYLIAAVLNYDEADTIPDSVIFSLIPPRDPRDRQIHRQRMEALTSTQKQVLHTFIEFLKHNHGEDDPLGDLDRAAASL